MRLRSTSALKGPRFGPRLAVALAAAILASTVGCDHAVESAAGSVESKTVKVKTVKAIRQDIVRKVVLPASVRADSEVTLYAKVTGYLKTITKDRGDKVKAGELIARLEIPEMISEIAHAKASFAIEATTFKRLENIRKVEKSAVTDQDLDLAGAKRDMAEATLKRLETLMAYTEIRAPFDGSVTERFADPGAFIQQGKIVSIVDISKVRILLDVPEAEVRFAPVGTEATVRLDALPGRSVKGRISRSAGSLDPVMRTMRVEIDIPNEDFTIYPGMFAHVELGLERHPNALVIPIKAVVVRQDHSFVFVNSSGKAKKVSVDVGTEDGEWIEACKGLTGDELIIVPDGRTLVEGMAVTEGT
jgi:membrane fusion protein (multidrug efflux system)